MKVLQLIDRLEVGGAERVAVDLSILLKREGVAVDFLNLLYPSKLDGELRENNIQVAYLNRKNKYNPFTLLRLFLILNSYSIVHVHSRHVLRYVGLTLLVPYFLRNYKVVFHDHYGSIDTDESISLYLKKCIKNCHAYIGVSDKLVAWANEHRLNASIYLLKNIVRKKKPVKKANIQSEIMVIGNFREQKNYEFLLSLAEKLPDTICLDLYGAVVEREYYESILTQLDERGLTKRINIIVDETASASLITNYKMAVHCATSETGPLVAIEYMAQHLPFIMYNTGAVANTLKAYEYDLIMDTFDATTWSKKIMGVLKNPTYFKSIEKQLSLYYTKFFSEQNYVATCLNIYQHILRS
ncbi:glycosyltransferase family 4 protein [Marixanthomonas spongiae]|uniref:Glycosyltransferase n=1 Tax=Marixanthomonas spongiae TaxID=2174845 RepID=A0A2U0I5S8_9FLAO|nr:glycosyltransferase family 4 protein [Marixanthomonas spongiae]PVW16471.1 hypothetical protein DDV96_04235 [Marixanthomonas spongiae]